MTENIIYFTGVLITSSILTALYILARFLSKRDAARFALELQNSRESIKEKREYERRLSELGQKISLDEQSKILAHIYEILNRASLEYDRDPKAVPNAIVAALLDISYTYTIIKNE